LKKFIATILLVLLIFAAAHLTVGRPKDEVVVERIKKLLEMGKISEDTYEFLKCPPLSEAK